jgi:5-methylcytosine-specific restriction endonuclease McrA
MGLRQRVWCRKQRVILQELLGAECLKCHTIGTKKNPLEFDCKIPRGDKHHRMEWSQRMSFYRKEYRDNNLQLLCRKCHRNKTTKDIYDCKMLRMSNVL